MTRDFDLIRDILFQVEKAPAGDPLYALAVHSEIENAALAEHVQLLIERGLIEGEVRDFRAPMFTIHRLAWAGHDFVNNARNDTIWKKVMAEAKEKGASVTLTVLNGLLTKAAEKYAGLGDENP